MSTLVDSIFTKGTASIVRNTHAARIFLRLEISNWYLKMLLGFILTISKQNCARLGSFPYKHPSKNYCCNPHMSGSFLELLFFLINVGIPLCHYAHAEVYKWPFHLNSQDSKGCSENGESVSTHWWIFIVKWAMTRNNVLAYTKPKKIGIFSNIRKDPGL